MQDPFDQKKQSILAEIGATNDGTPDLSPKGSIDEICIPIINIINSSKDMVTTLSCSGRVSVFLEGKKNIDEEDVKIGSKGNEGRWIFVTHIPEELEAWYKKIDFNYKDPQEISTHANTRYILFKFEPLILHVKCRDMKVANTLYTTAMNCGFRESGIGSNNLVAIRTSIKLDIPIGYMEDDSLVSIVSEEYLELSTKLSLDRFKENFKKLDILSKAVKNMVDTPIKEVHTETKEERRERKIREGMARRDDVKKLKEQKKKEKELEAKQS